MRKTDHLLSSLLPLVLALGLLLSSACQALQTLVRPTPAATPTPTVPATPAWEEPATYRVAMLSSAADDVNKIEQPTFYHIHARLDLSGPQPRVYATQDTHYTNRTPVDLDTLAFRLFPNKPSYGSALTFSKLTVGGGDPASEYQSEKTALVLTLPHWLPCGQSVDVHMEYDVTIPKDNVQGYGTFNYQDGILLLSNFFPLVAVYDAGGWSLSLAPDYGDPVYAEASFFSLEFSAPKGYTVVTSGSTTGKQDNEDGTVTWSCVSGPMRDMMVVVSDRFESTSTAVGFIRVNSYYLAEHKRSGEQVLGYARDALRAYQRSFGLYPFAELDVVEAPIYAGGMEYPGLVMVAEQYYPQGGEYFEFIAAHEVAHQWWYSLVGDDQVNTPWLDESLANFSTVYYYEATYDRARAELVFQNYVASRYQSAKNKGADNIVNQPVAAFSPEDYGLIVYGKGAVFFSELRKKLGDEAMLAFLRAYFQDREYKLTTGDDLLRVAEQSSGQDLHEFYQQWILSAK
jgi:hypothetical protein